MPQQGSSSANEQTHYDVLRISPKASQEEIKTAYRSLVVECHPDKLPQTQANAEARNVDGCQDVSYISGGLSDIDFDEDEGHNLACLGGSGVSEPVKPTASINGEDQSLVSIAAGESAREMRLNFIQVQAAYQCLRDPIKRRQYDESMSRTEERDEWKFRGAVEVNLSDMESDMCCVVDDEDSDDEERGGEGELLQRVFFHSCRCGDTFEIVQEDLLESIRDRGGTPGKYNGLSHRVWQCQSCSLTIRINVNIDLI